MKPRVHDRLRPLGAAPEPPPRLCDHPGCDQPGEYRAPKSRERLKDYYWFCLEHVRDYNKSWNYYAGMSAQEIEDHVRAATTWERPTWRLGAHASRVTFEGPRFADRFGLFGQDAEEAAPRRGASGFPPGSAEDKALRLLDMDARELTRDSLKTRYKVLAKRLHPDINPGDREAENRLKDINQAYKTLRDYLNARPCTAT